MTIAKSGSSARVPWKLYGRWELASRDRLTGVDLKPPYAAVVKSHGSERLRKRHEEHVRCDLRRWVQANHRWCAVRTK